MKTCSVCNKEEDTRPYGHNGAEICFDCAMSTPERKAEAEKQLDALLDAAGPVVLLTEDGPVPMFKNNLH